MYKRPGDPAADDAREAAIIGGGIASALLSLALLRRGWQVTLYCADEAPAQERTRLRPAPMTPPTRPPNDMDTIASHTCAVDKKHKSAPPPLH